MVVSKDTYASNWMGSHYNLQYVPTVYYDGGDWISVGGYTDTAVYTWRIINSGLREVPDIDLDISMVWLGDYAMEVTVTVTNRNFVNVAPDGLAAPVGPDAGLDGEEQMYTAVTTDPDGDDLYYMWDWGNDGQSDWVGPFASGEEVNMGHIWNAIGEYSVMVKAKDVWGEETPWSAPSNPAQIVARGDGNGDYDINVADAVYMINYVFKFGPPPEPELAGDANCDSQANVADAVYLINYTFNGGPPPGCAK